MRKKLVSESSHGAFRPYPVFHAVLAALSLGISRATAAPCTSHDPNPAAFHGVEHPASDGSNARLNGALFDYNGHTISIAMWQARQPRTASRVEDISSRSVREIVTFLRGSRNFHEIIEKLEAERKERFVRVKNMRGVRYVRDPHGASVRETGIVVWIPRGPGQLGVYAQRRGGIYIHSDFSDDPKGDTLVTPCDVIINAGAKYQVRVHTHPWGTVPSAGDLENTAAAVADLIVSEKDGIPTVYVYSAWGSVWELPTALFRPVSATQQPDHVVAQR